jgi:hypothetical protein
VTRRVTTGGVPPQMAAEDAERSAKRFEHGVADVMWSRQAGLPPELAALRAATADLYSRCDFHDISVTVDFHIVDF